jgi:hypothetical protein
VRYYSSPLFFYFGRRWKIITAAFLIIYRKIKSRFLFKFEGFNIKILSFNFIDKKSKEGGFL